MIANNYAKTDHYSPEQATTLPYISHTDLVRTSSLKSKHLGLHMIMLTNKSIRTIIE